MLTTTVFCALLSLTINPMSGRRKKEKKKQQPATLLVIQVDQSTTKPNLSD